MTKALKRPYAVGMLMLTSVLLAGCSAGSDLNVSAMERDQAQADILPDEVLEGGQSIDPASTRLAGETAGTQVFVAHSDDESNLCLVIVAGPNDWTAGCSDGRLLSVQLGKKFEAKFTTDGAVPAGEESWVVLDDDVLARTL